jgi:4-hydroxybenzoate polyprenyltransferase
LDVSLDSTAGNSGADRRARGVRETAAAVLALMRVHSPWGTFLLLLPSLWTLVLAGKGHPPLALLAIFTVGAFLMRSAGCIVNDIADRRIDPLVERTKSRPLASGRLGIGTALVVFAVLVAASVLLIAHLNRLTLLLAAAGLFWAVLYPFTKRVVAVPQAFLGIAFGWGTFMAWAAVRNEVALTPTLVFAATICWAVAYDTIYAIQDIDDDRRIGVKSSAILFGDTAWAWVGGLLIATCALFAWAALREGAGPLFLTVLAACAVYFMVQAVQVRRGLDRPGAFRLFKAHVAVGFVLFAALWMDLA